MNLTGKTVLITGASAGIGRSVALQLGGRANNLIITARRADLLEQVATEIMARGGSCLPIAADALDEAAVKRVIEQGIQRYGRIDAALLNIGEGPSCNMANASAAFVKETMRFNYDVTVNYLVPLIAHMKRPDGGLIAHTNSLAGFLAVPMQGPYSAAKAACRILLDTCRTELAGHRIRFTSICPGFVATERTANDGIPAPFEISADRAAAHIIAAMEREALDALFPWPTRLLTRLLQWLPRRTSGRLMLKMAPPDY